MTLEEALNTIETDRMVVVCYSTDYWCKHGDNVLIKGKIDEIREKNFAPSIKNAEVFKIELMNESRLESEERMKIDPAGYVANKYGNTMFIIIK